MSHSILGKSRQPRRTAALALAATSLAVPLVSVTGTQARATYGGDVGDLAFSMTVAGNTDVYTAAADGSHLTRLTDHPGFDACTAYSPSGENLAFCSNRSGAYEIWTMTSNGNDERQLTHLGGRSLFPDYSPSGDEVAFEGGTDPSASPDLWRIDTDGTSAVQLTTTPGVAERFPVWRPKRGVGIGQIAFVRDDSVFGSQIWLMRGDGAKQQPLTADATLKDQLPDWSPDGKWLAYEAAGDIWVMRADGSEQQNLTNTPEVEFGTAWSPDGQRIAFLRDPADPTRRVWTMRPDGSDQRVLLPGDEHPQFVPAWAPAPRQ